MISRNQLEELAGARTTLCNFCEADECDKCIVTNLINKAYSEAEERPEVNEQKDTRVVLKCVVCGKIMSGDDKVWRVISGRQVGGVVVSPTCCDKCAAELQENTAKPLENLADLIRRQSVQIMKADDYFRF